MAKKNVMGGSSVRYHKLSKTDDGFVDLQFRKPEPKVPWKAIALAVFLFVVGTSLIVFASLLFTGHIGGKEDGTSCALCVCVDALVTASSIFSRHSEGAWPLLILGSLMFIPGFYHVRIAYYAYKKYPGYSFDDIPDFD